MGQRFTGRKRALIGLTALALVALTALAPAASAQIPSVPDAPVQLPGGGGGSNPGSSSGGDLVDTVGGVADTTTDTVGNVGSGTTDAIGNVGSDVTDGVSGAGEKVVDETKKTVENTTRDTGEAVNNAVGGGIGDLGGSVDNPLLNVKNPLDRDRDGKRSPKGKAVAGGGTITKREAALRAEMAAERRENRLADAKRASLANVEKRTRDAGGSVPVALAPPQRETFITQLADAAKEAAEKLAFPLGLALMVGAFLMVQGRIDRKDAKLALAPIDSEQDLLSFQ